MNDSEWEVVKVPDVMVLKSGEVVPNPHTYIRNKNGLIMDPQGITREWAENFLFKGSFGEFMIYARRWGDENNPNDPTDTYIVYLYWPYMKIEEVELARPMVKDIESALFNYPATHMHNFIPVSDVLFKLGDKPNEMFHAEDIR